MSLFGSSRDDRRRRTLAEDRSGDSTAAAPPGVPVKTGGKPQRYAAGARRDNHRRATDFIPRGGFSIGLWYAAGLAAIGGIVCGFALMADLQIADSNGVVPLLNAARGDSLAGYFSSLVFGLSAASSLLVYSIRRHKVDDYRGRYRLWLWCAAACMLMSIDATANLHSPFSQLMTVATGWSPLGISGLWWIGVWGGILAVLTLRLVFETRECRTATAGIFLAVTASTVALAIEEGWLIVGRHSSLVAIACRLVGELTLLTSIGVYARHVLLDAEGLITLRPPKPKREKPEPKAKQSSKSPDAGRSLESTRIDSAHRSVEKRTDLQPPPAKTAAVASISANRSGKVAEMDEDDEADSYDDRRSAHNRHDEDDDDDSSDSGRKLSKAERKRLRRMKRQQEADDS